MRSSKEIMQELEDLSQFIKLALDSDVGIIAIDLLYIAQRVNDLKQELRIAEAQENI